jgi:hypothetical protein
LLKPVLNFTENEMISLVPNSGVQFIDFAFNLSTIQGKSRSVTFRDRVDSPGEVTIHPVHPAPENADYRVFRPALDAPLQEVDEDEVYSLKSTAAVSRFDGQWLPFPFFRRTENGFDEGPTTWARIRTVALPEPDATGCTHRVVLAFDTLLTPRLPGQPYTAPEETSDATDKITFGFCADHDRNISFMGLSWVDSWLRETYLHGIAREKNKPVETIRAANLGEHWAAYMAYIDAIKTACTIPTIELVDVFPKFGRKDPVGVSLVLDVGNSRMCGVLVEDADNSSYAELAQTYRLELRDLSKVEQVYSEPFESRIEFAAAGFGPISHTTKSQRSGRDAFWWPSPVRVGPEATRLASMTDGTEGTSGLSSPKRYLWDLDMRPQPWSNNNANIPAGEEPQEIRGPMISRLTEAGQLVSHTKGGTPGLMRRYSRASIYMLMLSELLIHAVTMVNSVDVRRNRANSAQPRAVKQIILTLPTATPLAEQKLMRARVREAVEMVWTVMGWNDPMPSGQVLFEKPKEQLDWDEATCTHLVYLYNEVFDKFGGSPREFFSLIAQQPRNLPGAEQLRMASIDIGGGTTDLMILDHVIQPGTDTVLVPEQVFREGFRLAGDDILKEVIEHHILPGLTVWLAELGVPRPEAVLARVFGGNTDAMGQRERTMRAQLVSQLLSSAAIGLMKAYEKGNHSEGEHMRLGSLLLDDTVITKPALEWFNDAAGFPDGAAHTLLDAQISFSATRLERLIDGLIGPMIRDLCDLVRCHDCDILLVSGRPSKFPIVRRMIEAAMPLPANRIISMGDYQVGSWYPFRDDDFTIRDPKTTAVVGAMLAYMGSQSASNLTLKTDGLKMRSTAKYIGVMDASGKIPTDKVLLKNVDLDTGDGVDEFVLKLEGSTFIGFRQLPIARWQSSPLYHVQFSRPDRMAGVNLPLHLTFERKDVKEGEEEFGMEDFKLTAIEDNEGNDMTGFATIRLQTMIVATQSEAGYWLDTGVLQMART